MVLSLEEFDRVFNWNDAVITYLQMASNSVHMDVTFVTFKQSKNQQSKYFPYKYADIKVHIIFKDVTLLTDYYYSPLNKLLERFTCPYICDSNEINEKGEFVIDDCLRIVCKEVEVNNLPR